MRNLNMERLSNLPKSQQESELEFEISLLTKFCSFPRPAFVDPWVCALTSHMNGQVRGSAGKRPLCLEI